MNARKAIARARIGIYVVVVLVVVLFVLRYDLLTLPREGCSPLADYAPGDRLVIDRWIGTPMEGDAVLFGRADGELLLGRVGTIPPSAPSGMHAAIAAGDLWLVTEVPACPGRDSRILGPIPVDEVVGVIRLALPF